jgi:hypothetical protein
MDGLVERWTATVGTDRPKRGRRQHAQRSRRHRRRIRQDVAKHVVGERHVELRGLAHQLHGAIIHQHVAELDVLELGVVRRLHFLPP